MSWSPSADATTVRGVDGKTRDEHEPAPYLTVLWHPHAARVGDVAPLPTRLSRLEPLPDRPTPPAGSTPKPPFPYALPGAFTVSDGMGAVSEIGVASRGITLDAPRGAALTVPGSGKVLFAGPSLYGQDYDATGLVIRPPARQGDIHRAVLDGADAIGLIDGVFGFVPSVWHKEILFALVMGTGGRVHSRLGGLLKENVSVHDGQR